MVKHTGGYTGDRNSFSRLNREASSTNRQGGLREHRDFKTKIYLRPETMPAFRKARPVPFAIREMVAAELDRLEASDIIPKVERTVNVVNTDKSIRVCGDYKVTVNPHVMVDKYPVPTAEDIFATLAGEKFTKLDLAHAYNHLELDEESKKMLTINTHKGLHQPNRLSYGVNSAPVIFQRTTDKILPGIDGVACYLVDDILITAMSTEKHLQHLDEVLNRLQRNGVRLELSKCKFLQEKIEYLGHMVTREGMCPTEEKMAALKKAATPTNVTELRSHLGLLKYYMKFLPDLSTLLAPLNALTHSCAEWS